jgi:hypothetical protein
MTQTARPEPEVVVIHMFARFVVAFTGAVTIVAGLALVVAPRAAWHVMENRIVMPGGPVPAHFYVIGIVVVVWGLALLYAGVKRLTYYSLFVSLIGVLLALGGLCVLAAPAACVHFARSVYLDQPERKMLILSYVGGVLRLIIGYFLMMAALIPRQTGVR